MTSGVAKTVGGDIDLFGHEGQAKMYREFRPVYPDRLVEYVASLIPDSDRKLYIDVACGSGQLTSKLGAFYESVIGVDKSFEQLGQAKDSKVEWKAGSAFDLCVPSETADLVTVAQGLHWLLPYDRFFDEVDRVLRPGGYFAAVAYAFPRLLDPGFNKLVDHFYVDILGGRKSPGEHGCLWETNRPTIDGFYADVPFPHDHLTKHFIEKVSLTIEHYTNYLRTLSAYRTLMRTTSPNPDPIDVIHDELTSRALNGKVDVEIDFFVVSYMKV
jgi:ubiquinone/menaquinone biosynthesis C-methylase UbiE